MPKRLREYSLAEHLHLRPLTHAWKTWRYALIDRWYMGRPAASSNAGRIRKAVAGRDVLVTVAFQDPDALRMHLALARRYVRHDLHLVVDNSLDEAVAAANESACRDLAAAYLRLPANPWTRRNDSRSHGIALNWTWRNVLLPGRPRAFGLLDQDLFAVAPSDPFEPLAAHAFYGDLRPTPPRWFLWAGFSFFRFDAVAGEPLDFGLDWFVGLDTGGANWEVLYRHVDMHALPQRPVVRIEAIEGMSVAEAYFEQRVGWIHEVGWPHDPAIRRRKRDSLRRLLAPHLAAAGPSALPRGEAPGAAAGTQAAARNTSSRPA